MRQLILFLAFLPIYSFAQVDFFGRTYSDELPEEFKLKVPEVRAHIHDGIPPEYKDEKYPRRAFKFADVSALQLTDLVSSGQVYSDWPAFEDYLNEIFRKIIPKELADDPSIHAYLIKNGTYNAFMTPSGRTFFHMGLFDQVYNEATIAGVLSHELAHYVFRHSLKGFVKSEQGEFKSGMFRKKESASHFSIQNELQADSMAMIWMQQSGYNVNALIEGFKITERLEVSALLKMRDRWELKETSHPRSTKRIETLQAMAASHKDTPGEYFLISQEKFQRFTRAAKPEILKHLLDNFAYSLCIEKAFTYHIYDENNPVYIYYLMEAIRRYCYLNTDNWREKFIVNNYYEIVQSKEGKKKVKMKDHLFKKFPLDILRIKKETARYITARFYWKDEPKFTTYEEAFDFFFKVSELLEVKECLLSFALSATNSKEARNEYLKKYLAHEEVQYRDFAQSLLDDKIRSTLPDKKLTVLSAIDCVVQQGKEGILVRNEKTNDEAQLNEIFLEVMKEFPGKDRIFLSDLKNDRLSDYQMLLELEQFSFSRTIAKGQRTELHILNPRYWEIMNKLGVNEIEFVNASYYDSQKADKSLEGYKSVIEKDYNTLLSEVKRSRYIDVFITSVREIEGGVMKIKYYGGEDKLVFKEAGYEQLVALMKRKLNKKEEFAQKTDKENKHN